MTECIFCKIVGGEIPAELVYQDDEVLAFRDINPQAPIHMLIVPKRHIATLNDITPNDAGLIGKLYLVARQLANDMGVADNGYRTLINCNKDGGQDVFHIHLHLLAGRRMGWPPG
jgi:histidine triad (HIT) family protein